MASQNAVRQPCWLSRCARGDRLSGGLLHSTALALVVGSAMGNPAAVAQSIVADGNVLPGVPAPPLPVWNPTNLRVGVDGEGELAISDGGTVAGPGQALVGANAGSQGTVTVSGAGSSLSTATQMHVGSHGTGVLTIEDGAAANIGTFLYIGRFEGAEGLVIVSSPGSSLTSGNMIQVGSEGNGALIVENGGVVNSTNVTRIGFSPTGVGSVLVHGAGSSWTTNNSMSAGFDGHGTLTIQDGGIVGNVAGFIGREAGSTGEVTVTGAGSTWSNSGPLHVGSAGDGVLRIEDGGAVSSTDGRIGQLAGSVGEVTVAGAGSIWSSSSSLIVGQGGHGTLVIENGGAVDNVGGFVGFQAGSTGEVAVWGAGSTWTNSGTLAIGTEGHGTLTIGDGGAVSNVIGRIGSNPGSEGVVTVTGPGTTWTNSDILAIGDVGHGTLSISNGGAVSNTRGLIGNSGSGVGSVSVSGPGSSWTSTDLHVGHFGTGTLSIADGGAVSSETGAVGNAFSSSGEAAITGAGSIWDIAGTLSVGNFGVGTLIIEDGGAVTNVDGYIGRSSIAVIGPASGEVVIRGPQSSWTNSGALGVGGLGNGTLTIANGAHVGVGGGNGIVHVAEAATANGVVNIGAAAGDAPAGAGTLDAAEIRFGAGSGEIRFNHVDAGHLFAPVITGNGALTQESGTTVLTGDSTYSGGTTIAGGVLQLGNGGTTGSVTSDIQIDGAGTLRVDRSNAWTYAGVLSGTGAFDHLGSGATTLTGDSAGFAGTTTVANGSLIVGMGGAGALGGTIDVLSGALLGGTGTVGSAGQTVTVAAGAVHAPGNAIGVQTIAGHYVLRGTLVIEGTPAGTDMLVVQGDVDIAGATLDLLLSPNTAQSWQIVNGPFTIIDNLGPGAVAGTFATVNNNLIFLDPTVNYFGGDGNDVTLELVRNDIAVASVALTPNQTATAGAIDTVPYGAVWNAIVLMSDEDAVRRSLGLLSGEIHATSLGVLLEESRFPRIAVSDRLRAAFAAPPNTGTAVWAHGYGSWANWQGDGDAASLKRNTGGLLLGLDGRLGDWRAGVMTGWNRTGVTVADRASTAEAGTWHAGVYGGTEWGNLGLRLGLLHGEHGIETTRMVALPGLSETLRGAYGASTTQAFGELAYTVNLDTLRYEPFVNLAHIRTRSDGFAETGGDAALSGQPGAMSATVMTLGQRIETAHDLFGLGVRTSAMIGWQHAFGDPAPLSTHGFSAGNSFTIAGTPFARDSVLVEGGFEVSLSETATIGASYTGRLAQNGQDHAVNGALRVGF